MIIDSHVHVWNRWAFDATVPDDTTRGTAQKLIYEMDRNEVDQALVIVANNERNPSNNRDAAEAVKLYPSRLHHLASLDFVGLPCCQLEDPVMRLYEVLDQFSIKGCVFVVGRNAEWLESSRAYKLFEVARSKKLIMSLAVEPQALGAFARIARKFEDVTFLCHHMGGARIIKKESTASFLRHLLPGFEAENITFKISGFHHIAHDPWDFPHSSLLWIVRIIYDHIGASRMCWGSDFPVANSYMTYRQALEVIRKYCSFIPPSEMDLVLGTNVQRLLTGKDSNAV